jgi:hypothetical protein
MDTGRVGDLLASFYVPCLSPPAFPTFREPGNVLIAAYVLVEQGQHRMQLEANVDSLLQRGWALRHLREDTQRSLEPDSGIRQLRPPGRLDSRPPEIVHRLLPHLAPEGVVGEPLDLLGSRSG